MWMKLVHIGFVNGFKVLYWIELYVFQVLMHDFVSDDSRLNFRTTKIGRAQCVIKYFGNLAGCHWTLGESKGFECF